MLDHFLNFQATHHTCQLRARIMSPHHYRWNGYSSWSDNSSHDLISYCGARHFQKCDALKLHKIERNKPF
jgi:hypothetical protein